MNLGYKRMIYKKIGEYVHLLMEPLPRKQTVLEFIYTSGGSWFEKSMDRGKKHLLEHCIVARTKKQNFQEFKDYQFSQNINVNAYTGSIIMGLDFHGHYSDTLEMLSLMTEVAFKPTFDDSILHQEKEIVLREISERRGEPSYKLYFDKVNQIFRANSYDTHEVLGDSECVRQTTIADFERLMMENLQTSHLIINIAGGFEADKMEEFLQSELSKTKIITNFEPKLKQTIDFQPKSQFNQFGFLPIVHELAHEHAEVSLYIPCEVNFENRAVNDIFSELFLKWHGVLYDTLRNKLGLIYSMSGSFKISQQMLVIDFATEIENVEKCLQAIYEILSDFEKAFEAKKFEELKQVLNKKMEISSDNLTTNLYFCQNSLMDYGVFEDLNAYLKRLMACNQDDIKKMFNLLKSNLKDKKVVIVSKDAKIEKLLV